jgi:hypothetical protein
VNLAQTGTGTRREAGRRGARQLARIALVRGAQETDFDDSRDLFPADTFQITTHEVLATLRRLEQGSAGSCRDATSDHADSTNET